MKIILVLLFIFLETCIVYSSSDDLIINGSINGPTFLTFSTCQESKSYDDYKVKNESLMQCDISINQTAVDLARNSEPTITYSHWFIEILADFDGDVTCNETHCFDRNECMRIYDS